MVVLIIFCSFLSSLSCISSQILESPRDEPLIFSSNPATQCCRHTSPAMDLSSYQKLLSCVNQTTESFPSPFPSSTSSLSISLVSYFTSNIIKYGSLGAAINAIYAAHHNYKFKILTPETGGEYFPEDQRWNKVKILEDALDPVSGWAKSSDYILWLDSDFIFLDLGMKIELISQAYPDSHVIMSEDVDLALGIANTGFVLVKNSDWSRQFLSAWWNNYNKSQGMDQWVLSKLYEDHKEEYQHKIKLLRVDAVNTNFPSWMKQRPENQVLHLAGANRQMREQAFHKGLQQICENVNHKGGQGDAKRGEKKKIPRQLGLSREALAELDSSLPRAQILRDTLNKIQKLETAPFSANQVIEV
jgi:hypothetical protein